jgi:cytoskeletal protein CcmA (bactofilin family)
MAELRIRKIDETELDTVLAEDIDFDGELSFKQPLLVKGRVTGQVRSESDLYINESASVDATISAATVSVKGTVHGDITASTRLELFSSSDVSGSIRTGDLVVQSGCRLNGSCEMLSDGTGSDATGAAAKRAGTRTE